MILSGKKIKSLLNDKIFIDGYDDARLNPNSYNLCLHDELLVYDTMPLDMKTPNTTSGLKIPAEGLLLNPHTLYLGRTKEYTRTHGYVPMLEGRSSLGRLGLYIHVTAGFGDVGFEGFWTLELHCIHPIIIYPNIEICQIFYHTIEGEYEAYKSNKYQKNSGIQASMMYKDFENLN